MKLTAFLLVILSGICVTPALHAQAYMAHVSGRQPEPLLYVRIVGPAGMRVTFYQGAAARELTAPVTVGLRPGYIHRIKVAGLPQHPNMEFFPTLAVIGTLTLPHGICASDHPAPIVIGEPDTERVMAGSLITKVVFLESPDKAEQAAREKDQPFEIDMLPGRDPMEQARRLGRPMVVLRMGTRSLTTEEIARQSVPGTVLLPGQTALGPAAYPPCLPCVGPALIDPIAGPKLPEEECLKDGGDIGLPAGLDNQGRLRGLDPSDTVAEYSDSSGKRHVVPSNRICLCVPRFAVARSEQPLNLFELARTPSGQQSTLGQVLVQGKVPSLTAQQNEQLKGATGRSRPSGAIATTSLDHIVRLEVLHAYELEVGLAKVLDTSAAVKLSETQRLSLKKQLALAAEFSRETAARGVENVTGPVVAALVEGLGVIRATAETRDMTCVCGEIPHAPDKPLTLCKWADAQCVQLGDVVTFYLKYTNHGYRPITDVAVSDSLTTRLEYVPGTAKSDRNAIFTTQDNEAGSVILRWEISGKLLPGESGVVSFRLRVR
jgi:uncharacterized repeat protein (TIGR01451 family)